MSQVVFHSATNLKLQNIYVALNAVNKVITPFDFSNASCHECIPVEALRTLSLDFYT